VLVVGGLREKALAAYRAGVKTMLFPASNVKDLDDVPEDVRSHLDMIPVESMDDVFSLALHRVIVPQRIAGDFVIEVAEDQAPPSDEGTETLRRAARRARRA